MFHLVNVNVKRPLLYIQLLLIIMELMCINLYNNNYQKKII